MEQGIVRMRVAFVPRSAEIQPMFLRFVTFSFIILGQGLLRLGQKKQLFFSLDQ
jgi:hypothetical protein